MGRNNKTRAKLMKLEEIKKNTKKANETKSWFFENISKIDKFLAVLSKKWKEKTQINRIRYE